jgi:hypothetical protein
MAHTTHESKKHYEGEYGYEPESRRQAPDWLWPVLLGALALLLGLWAWEWSSSRHAEAPNVAVQTQAPVETFSKLNGIKVGDVDIGGLVKSSVDGLQSSLLGIKDEATAKAAMPALSQAASRFDQLTGLLSQMTPETRKALADSIASIRPKLNTLFDQAVGLPGVGPVIQPTVDAIRSKLDTLATV